jgi:hypothetical protein
MFFFGLFVEDGALLGVTASRTDIGFTLEAEDRLSQVLKRAYQNHLSATCHAPHDMTPDAEAFCDFLDYVRPGEPCKATSRAFLTLTYPVRSIPLAVPAA